MLTCDLRRSASPTFETIDALARLRLDAGRLGLTVRLVGTTRELRELLGLAGLADRFVIASAVEARRQPKQREEALGIQEEGDGGDSAA